MFEIEEAIKIRYSEICVTFFLFKDQVHAALCILLLNAEAKEAVLSQTVAHRKAKYTHFKKLPRF